MLKPISSVNINNTNQNNNKLSNRKSDIAFQHNISAKEDSGNNKKVKAGVLFTTLLASGIALAAIAKKQGFSLSPSKIFNTKVKDWAIFKLPKDKNDTSKVLEFKEKEILMMAGGSVLGGLAGGYIFDDKKYMRSKIKESINQMLGTIMVPLAFVAGPTRVYQAFKDLHEKNVDTKHLKLKNASKVVAKNRFLKFFCPVAVSTVSLGAGIIAGNKVSNYINEKLHKEKVERKIKATDFAPHVDDACLAITLMAEKSPISSFISKLVPVALLVPGLEVGNAKKQEQKV